MRSLVWSKTFTRSLKRTLRKQPAAKKSIEAALGLLKKDPFAEKLATHKLRGKLSGTWACTVEFDLRILFDFIAREDQEENDIFLIGIGAHDEVY